MGTAGRELKHKLYLMPLLAALAVDTPGAQHTVLVNAPEPAAPVSRCAEPADSVAIQPDSAGLEGRPAATLSAGDWSSIGVAATFRVLDYTTTEKAMAHPQEFHEVLLPSGLVRNRAGFAAFQASTVAVDYYAYRICIRHGLRTFAVRTQWIYNLSLLYPVIENYRVLAKHNLQ